MMLEMVDVVIEIWILANNATRLRNMEGQDICSNLESSDESFVLTPCWRKKEFRY